MNIAIINEFFPPFVTGGTEIFLNELAQYLKSRGHKITIITSDQGQAANKDFKTYKIRSSPLHLSHRYQFSGITTPWMFFNRGLRKGLNKIYKKEGTDLLHVNNLFHLSFSPIQNSIPFVLDVHDYWPICFTKDLYRNRKHCKDASLLNCASCVAKKSGLLFIAPVLAPGLMMERKLSARELHRAKEIVCHSGFVRGELKKRGYSSEVIPYPWFGKPGKSRKPGKCVNLLFVGRVEEKKGADLILKTAQELNGKLEFRIDVIGEGPLLGMIDRKDLNIFTHGFLGKERFRYFEEADFMLIPSRWPEPFGIVVLEAMAHKLPVIALESGGLAELVRKNRAGFLAKEADFTEKVLDVCKKTESLKHYGKNWEKEYNKERVFKKYEDIFIKNIQR